MFGAVDFGDRVAAPYRRDAVALCVAARWTSAEFVHCLVRAHQLLALHPASVLAFLTWAFAAGGFLGIWQFLR